MTSTAGLRQRLRVVHLVTGTLVATYVYLPPGGTPWLRWLLMVAVIPGLTVSGMWMWQQAAARRLWRRLRGGHRRSARRDAMVDPASVSVR